MKIHKWIMSNLRSNEIVYLVQTAFLRVFYFVAEMRTFHWPNAQPHNCTQYIGSARTTINKLFLIQLLGRTASKQKQKKQTSQQEIKATIPHFLRLRVHCSIFCCMLIAYAINTCNKYTRFSHSCQLENELKDMIFSKYILKSLGFIAMIQQILVAVIWSNWSIALNGMY